MIACAEAVRQLWEYLEMELDEDDKQRVDEHLAFCRRCCGELEFATELKRIMARSTEVDLPTPIEERLQSFIDDLEEAT
ncbi:MAG: zf-HC2 domain-containing protein [Actinomycetota bacterium]